jgi:glutathione S-transferase
MTGRYRFYASEVSYFSAKVRPALRYKRIGFDEILPTPEAYREVILPRTGLRFIPIVLTPEGEAWQDTSAILDALEVRVPDPPLYPKRPAQRIASQLLEIYADEILILPAMHYRWSFPESVAKARADFAANNGDPAAAGRFADRMSGSIRALGVVPETTGAIEAHTAALLAGLEAHFAAEAFLLGARPSLADCALMGPLYAHLYLDAVPGRLLRATAPRTCHWIERMNRPDPDATGDWLPEDALAPTLLALLALVGRDAVPIFLDTLRAVERWADAEGKPGETPPRVVGFHATTLRGASFQRYTSPYSLWMAQRVLDPYRQLDAAARERVDRALAGTGCEELLAYRPRHRIGKRGFALVLERPAEGPMSARE